MFFSRLPRASANRAVRRPGQRGRRTQSTGGDPLSGNPAVALWIVAALLALYAVGLFGFGCWNAWWRQFDGDMQFRVDEYAWFRDGVYPNPLIEEQSSSHPRAYTVYPPYALPMFAPFFEPFGLRQGRFLLEILSFGALVSMGLYAFRTLEGRDRAVAAVGAVAGAAVAANGTAITVGQFSILCAGLIALQIRFLEQGRPVVAGGCWALAMIKPQIALPFVLLFQVNRQQVGSLFGAMVLVGLSLLACVWTEVPPGRIVDHWRSGMSMRFAAEGYGVGPGAIANAFGLNFRLVQTMALGMLVALAIALTGFIRRHEQRALLPLAGACAVVGMFFTYHRHYDNVMLFPTLLATLQAATTSRRPLTVGVATAMLLSLVIPKRLLEVVPAHEIVQAVTWILGGVVPIWVTATSGGDASDPARVELKAAAG